MTTMSQWPFRTTTPCLSLSVPVPLGILNPDKSTVLSPPVPPCRPLSLSGSDYEQRRSQVRVLPSALLIFLQTEGFCCCSSSFRPAFSSSDGSRHCRVGCRQYLAY